MKRMALIFVLILLLLASGSAFADGKLPKEAAALFHAGFPEHQTALWDQCGHTAAAVLTDGQTQVLCIAEETGESWALAVANRSALRQDTAVTSLYLDTDETLFWSYNIYDSVTETYRAVRTDGYWRVANWMSSEAYGNGSIAESHLTYDSGCLHYSTHHCDENENILSCVDYAPVPANWLNELMPLEAFNDVRFPKPDVYYTHSWLSDEATALAAAELFPEYTFLGGCASREHLEFFLKRPNGDLVIASCRFDDKDGWKMTLSSPLPEGTTYGLENFTSSLVIGDLLVSIGPVDENACGVTYIYNAAEDDYEQSMFSLGKNWIASAGTNGFDNCYGDHPWDDITLIDWNSLPHTQKEALDVMDTSGWAVVSNPNPADRLHLRTKPERNAYSLGKYYNGTPVRVLEKNGDWARVDIFGVQGWMMKKYLVFGDAAHAVEAVFPSRFPIESKKEHRVYRSWQDEEAITSIPPAGHCLLVLGIVGDDWYHAWFPHNDLTGYVRAADWWEGNG